MSRIRRTLFTTTAILSALLTAQVVTVRAASPTPPFIPANADWLTTVNYFRAMAGEGPVTHDASLDAGAHAHSCYMLYNGITHGETPGRTGYTPEGNASGLNSNVAVSSSISTTARSHIELWMSGPFHALGILRPGLKAVGFGICTDANTPTWHSAATLDVLSDLDARAPAPSAPIVFPGDGTTTNLSAFVTESPNPLTYCGWSGGAGLPVVAMMPEAVNSASASITGPNGPIPVCTLRTGNTGGQSSTAGQLLAFNNAVTVLPSIVLSPGTYRVTITTQARTVTWSFTVDPVAATGIMPIPTLSASGPASAYTPITPIRFADSRTPLRITPALAGYTKRITIAGFAGLPRDITAISANFTVVGPVGSGYLTVYNCTSQRPETSTLNYRPGQTVANAGIFPLSSSGDLCIYTIQSTNLIIDITGYFETSGRSSFTATSPTPVLDTLTKLGTDGRLAAQEVVPMKVSGHFGVPSDATAIAVSVAGILPSAPGFISLYPCGSTRPVPSAVNPMVGSVRSNFAIVPLSSDGQACLYTVAAEDARVTLLGYFQDHGTGTFVPATPARVTDTRDLYRQAMNAGTDGQMVTPGQVYTVSLGGQRGIPANIQALSLNVTAAYAKTDGTLKVWECGAQPNVTTVSFPAGMVIASGLQVKLSSDGLVCFTASAPLHVIIDVNGWWNS